MTSKEKKLICDLIDIEINKNISNDLRHFSKYTQFLFNLKWKIEGDKALNNLKDWQKTFEQELTYTAKKELKEAIKKFEI